VAVYPQRRSCVPRDVGARVWLGLLARVDRALWAILGALCAIVVLLDSLDRGEWGRRVTCSLRARRVLF
jgi:hypothetical protein